MFETNSKEISPGNLHFLLFRKGVKQDGQTINISTPCHSCVSGQKRKLDADPRQDRKEVQALVSPYTSTYKAVGQTAQSRCSNTHGDSLGKKINFFYKQKRARMFYSQNIINLFLGCDLSKGQGYVQISLA